MRGGTIDGITANIMSQKISRRSLCLGMTIYFHLKKETRTHTLPPSSHGLTGCADGNPPPEGVLGLAAGQAADGVARRVPRDEVSDADCPQGGIQTPLDDGKQVLLVRPRVRRYAPASTVGADKRPLQRTGWRADPRLPGRVAHGTGSQIPSQPFLLVPDNQHLIRFLSD